MQVMHVLGFDPHAFAHFRDEQKRRRSEVCYAFLPMLWLVVCVSLDPWCKSDSECPDKSFSVVIGQVTSLCTQWFCRLSDHLQKPTDLYFACRLYSKSMTQSWGEWLLVLCCHVLLCIHGSIMGYQRPSMLCCSSYYGSVMNTFGKHVHRLATKKS
jgi:hypothetical protein